MRISVDDTLHVLRLATLWRMENARVRIEESHVAASRVTDILMATVSLPKRRSLFPFALRLYPTLSWIFPLVVRKRRAAIGVKKSRRSRRVIALVKLVNAHRFVTGRASLIARLYSSQWHRGGIKKLRGRKASLYRGGATTYIRI